MLTRSNALTYFLKLTLGLEAGDVSPVLELIYFPLAVSCSVLVEESGSL